jgi:hypothetical protein
MKVSVRIVLFSPHVRPLAILAWSATVFAIGFEALGAPLARASGSASWTVGMLLASQPVGTVVGAIFATRVPQPKRQRTMHFLALLAMVPLGFGLLTPALPILVVIGVISGLGMSFNVLASTAFVNRVDRPVRGRALGLVSTSAKASGSSWQARSLTFWMPASHWGGSVSRERSPSLPHCGTDHDLLTVRSRSYSQR